MSKIRERVVFDKNGRPSGVHLDFVECGELLAEIEAEDSVRAYEAAAASGEACLPFEQVVGEIERERS